jgi:uncharacterized protein YecT (DUF1311 family)
MRIAILGILLAALSTEADSGVIEQPIPACGNIQTSQQVDECAAEQYKSSDQVLNEVYKQLMRKIDLDYKAVPKLGEEYRSAVKRAQQAWLKFRDASCAVEAFEIESGSAAHTTTVNGCLARMSTERTRELKQLLSGR